MIHKSEATDPDSYQVCWFAQTMDSEPSTILGKSSRIEWDIRDGTWTGEVRDEEAARLRRNLVQPLLEQGWQVIEEDRKQVVLKRKQ